MAQRFWVLLFWKRFLDIGGDNEVLQLTVPPAVEFSLQPLESLLHGLVLLLLLLVLPLPLLRRQLQVDGGRVPDGLGTVEREMEMTRLQTFYI